MESKNVSPLFILFSEIRCSSDVATDDRCYAVPVALTCSLPTWRGALQPLLNDVLSYAVSTVNNVNSVCCRNLQHAVTALWLWHLPNYTISGMGGDYFFVVAQ